MKKSHDHTQLKRLAAISLCLVMCLSALAVLAPSASAAGEGETIPLYVWDGEGSTELASEAANWYQDIGGVITNDIAPTNNSHVLFDDTSTKNCTWDLDAAECTPYSITIATGYTGTVTQGDVDIGIGAGGYSQAAGTFTPAINRYVYCDGSMLRTGGVITPHRLNLYTTGSGTIGIDCNTYIRSWHNYGDYSLSKKVCLAHDIPHTFINCGSISIPKDLVMTAYCYSTSGDVFRNEGSIYGAGELDFILRDSIYEAQLGHVDVSVSFETKLTTDDCIFRMVGDAELPTMTVFSDDYSIILDINGHSLTADSITVGTGGAIVGNGTIINAGDLDASAGSFSFTGKYVQADGGTITLAPGQSFDRLEIASDDGRTASWSMTATGTVSPTVTGLKSGNYLWYLDGVEQGEVEAGKDGTIALSYQSTGLHTLSVEPTSMTAAMDGMSAAIGIIVVLAVLGGLFSMLGSLKKKF